MAFFLYVFFVTTVVALLVLSGLFAHATTGKRRMGWWTGVIFSVPFVILSKPSFQEFPQREAFNILWGHQKVTDWDAVAAQATHMNWLVFSIGLIVGYFFLKLIDNLLNMSEWKLSLIMLLLAFVCISTLIYIFYIGTYTWVIFSLVMGSLPGAFVHLTFSSNHTKGIVTELKKSIEQLEKEAESLFQRAPPPPKNPGG